MFGAICTFSTMYKAAVRTKTSYVLQGESSEGCSGGRRRHGREYDFFGTYRAPKTLDTTAAAVVQRKH